MLTPKSDMDQLILFHYRALVLIIQPIGHHNVFHQTRPHIPGTTTSHLHAQCYRDSWLARPLPRHRDIRRTHRKSDYDGQTIRQHSV
jgi:hypothetical protein